MIPLIASLYQQLPLLTLRDYTEILFFSISMYSVSVWLARDTSQNLLIYLYSYCGVLAIAYMTQLSSITFFLTFFAPVILVCFIIVHETTLQKNYVMLRNTHTPKKESRDWIEQLIRICLHNMHENKSLICLIEQTDSMQTVLTGGVHLEGDLHTGILEMLIKSPTFDTSKMVWLNKYGSLIGINAQWRQCAETAFSNEAVQKLDTFKQDGLLYTAKTDAIVFRSDPVTHSFDIIAGGTLFESVNAHILLTSLKKYLGTLSKKEKGIVHDTNSTQDSYQQPRS